ncbi:hypothetical protein CLU90_0633 [Janthinobacterium sp. 67]|uniref:DUF6150 family protein n=1 Tax=Janthinobacterium sp. 67 TaxID=2035207 RepID=UPI000C23EEB6|nr:DUF6150 family protein [Janthinobacterium sp. 67]PJJ17459.1 hypothetical protein CLU90_0633 [Janthinobacterium sp. 67]
MTTVYQTSTMGEARVRIALVDRDGADLLVHRVGSRGLAQGDALWFITREPQNANVHVYFTSQGMAELRVCFVDNRGEAGWTKPHPLHGRL